MIHPVEADHKEAELAERKRAGFGPGVRQGLIFLDTGKLVELIFVAPERTFTEAVWISS
jgi:hypothetical protein